MKKVGYITETAVMLALLVALQAITKPLGQLITGSFVNCVLAVTVLLVGSPLPLRESVNMPFIIAR